MVKERLHGLDIARGLALMGIIANHIFYVTHSHIAEGLQDYHAVLFMLLAGIMSTYAVSENYRLKSMVRGIVCIVLGLAIGAGNPEVDLILLNYGILFITLGLFVPKLKLKMLWLSGLLTMLIAPIVGYGIRELLGTPHGPNISILTIVQNPLLLVYDPIMSSHYPLFQWSAIFLIGAAIGKMNLKDMVHDKKLNVRILLIAISSYVVLKAVSVGLDMLINHSNFQNSVSRNYEMLLGQVETRPSDLVLSSAYSGTSLSLGSAILVSIAVIAICNLVCLRIGNVRPLEVLGQATLSVYCIHVVAHMVLNNVMNSYVYYVLTIIILYGIIMFWQKKAHTVGPIESIVNSIYKTELSKRESNI